MEYMGQQDLAISSINLIWRDWNPERMLTFRTYPEINYAGAKHLDPTVWLDHITWAESISRSPHNNASRLPKHHPLAQSFLERSRKTTGK
jgi:hypothetical protein